MQCLEHLLLLLRQWFDSLFNLKVLKEEDANKPKMSLVKKTQGLQPYLRKHCLAVTLRIQAA